VPTRNRKIRKHRGSRTHGWGQVGQHRGKGSKGGFGQTGGHKHGWTRTVKYDQDRYGKKGFTRPRSVRDATVNVGDLDDLAETLRAARPEAVTEESVTIDLGEMGYTKLLGAGTVTRKYVVTVEKWSRLAAHKIETAQGTVQNA
jgi:large subunit ribosomal protein L15